jgi:hypothetical protein
LLPRRWREALPLFSSIHWRVAAALSGIIESLLMLLALVYWYSYSVTHWAADAVSTAAKAGADIRPGADGVTAYAVMLLHPVTWLIVLCAFEGIVRFLGAAFTGDVLGIFPLFVLDRIFLRLTPGGRAERLPGTPSGFSSFFPWMRQRAAFLSHPVVADEVRYSSDATGEVMSISSSRPKSGWEPPRIIRCKDIYYRLEAASERSGLRPFLYVLRRLPAGVPSRTVISYSSDDPIDSG